MKKLLLAMVCLSVVGVAQAGIWKCRNARTGRIEYSDIACHGDSYDGNTIEATPNVLDSSGGRRQASITLRRKAEEDYRESLEAAASARTVSGRSYGGSAGGSNSRSCKVAKSAYEHAERQAGTPGSVLQKLNKAVWDSCTENVDNTILRNPATTSRVRLAAPALDGASAGGVTSTAISPAPTIHTNAMITNCDSSGCWDTKGQRYNSSGGGSQTMFRSDGKICTRIGTEIQCN